MISLGKLIAPEAACSYLAGVRSRMEYELVSEMSQEEYSALMIAGWRRFGRTLFRPKCKTCDACQSLRIDVKNFRPNQSQKRCWKQNHGVVTSVVSSPEVSDEKLQLYDRYHEFKSAHRGWANRGPEDELAYIDSFVDQPFPVQEWRYYLEGKLIGVGYTDELPGSNSAIYFYYDPAHRDRGLGTFNILNLIHHAAERGDDYVYLGYYVAQCPSLMYKSNFKPYQLFIDGVWQDAVSS